ncbi:hypothetical protein [Marinimicrobium sp. ARAG 43.8]|uniref:hypothetical protein n=1 Tax=Marinimicrobium sp. ARAG 43.8 TaxID=3418719 RepID=UPI003CF3BD66
MTTSETLVTIRQSLPPEQFAGFLRGSAINALLNSPQPDLEVLKSGRSYLNRLITHIEEDIGTYAYCWANGIIEFGKATPSGAIPIAHGPDQIIRDKVTQIAESRPEDGLDGPLIRVPGTSENDYEENAVAVTTFREQLKKMAMNEKDTKQQ